MQYFQVKFAYLGDERIPKILEVGTTWPEQNPPMIFMWDNVCRLIGGTCIGGKFMGENCTFILLPSNVKRQHIDNKQVTKIMKP